MFERPKRCDVRRDESRKLSLGPPGQGLHGQSERGPPNTNRHRRLFQEDLRMTLSLLSPRPTVRERSNSGDLSDLDNTKKGDP